MVHPVAMEGHPGDASPRRGRERRAARRDVMSENSTRHLEMSTVPPSADPRRESGARARGAADPAESPASTGDRGGRDEPARDRRVLVVEDEPASRRGLQDLLTAWGDDV